MLDDLKFIHDKDSQDALGVVEKQWQQLEHEFEFEAAPKGPIDNVVWGGMGGSAIPAQLSLSWPGHDKPFEICRNYDIPRYVGPNTLFVASSYSGNTEETLSALSQAEEKDAQIVVVAAGGKLADRAREAGHPLAVIPGGIQPRMTTLYFIKFMATMFEKMGLATGLRDQLTAASAVLKDVTPAWRADVPTAQNPAKQLAQELMGKSVVAYGGPKMMPVANKFKIAMNENAKNIAWWNQLPEFSHNEMIGWSSHPTDKPYGVVDIRSNLEHERVQKRFVVTERLLSGMRPAPHVVEPKGETLLDQLLWGLAFCDFTSLYVAMLNGIDPTPVDLVEKFKAELNK